MDTAPWYQSAIIRQQILQLILTGTALLGLNLDIDWPKVVDGILAGIAAVTALWTIFTRITKPAPNLSQAAVAKEIELVAAGKIPPSPTGPT